MVFNKEKPLLTSLLLSFFLKQIFLIGLVPIWHTPDEQAHFAQVAYFSEFSKMPFGKDDLNREISESEYLLGTKRDQSGNNKFTFHPEYRIEYTSSYTGKYENYINNVPVGFRREFTGQEAANYPPLYYWISSLAYKLFYTHGLIDRVFAVRFVSTLLSLLTVLISLYIGKLLFGRLILAYGLAAMVAFHPMFSLVSAGVNSDNLFNLFFTLMTYVCLLMIKRGLSKKGLFLSIIISYGMYLTKPQFILALPIFYVAILLSILINFKSSMRLKVVAKLMALPVLLFFLFSGVKDALSEFLARNSYLLTFLPGERNLSNVSFFSFFKQTIRHTIAEVIPWYWGVFNWLGVTYERGVHRIINRVMVLAAAGVCLKFFMDAKHKKIDYPFLFVLATSVIYFMGITVYNYLFYLGHGFPFGIQGRYFFPNIVSHMCVLLAGFTYFVPEKFQILKNVWLKLVPLGMVILQFIAIWTIAKSYYDLSSLQGFIMQASQYKPVIFKGNFLVCMFLLQSFTLLWLCFQLFNFPYKLKRG